jgi:hypothetical protein
MREICAAILWIGAAILWIGAAIQRISEAQRQSGQAAKIKKVTLYPNTLILD